LPKPNDQRVRTVGRGLDFQHKFNTSRWAEDRVHESLSGFGLVSVRLGASKVTEKITRDQAEIEVKEPDLILLKRSSLSNQDLRLLSDTNFDLSEVSPKTLRQDRRWGFLWHAAAFAVEIEFSPYKATAMKQRNWQLRDPHKKVLKHAKPPIAPNIWVKIEDLDRLEAWQKKFGVKIFVFHLFDEEAFGISLDTLLRENAALNRIENEEELRRRQLGSGIFRKEQNYNRVDQEGASERKMVFVIAPAASSKIAELKDVEVGSQLGISKSAKYVSHVIFKGGTFVPLAELWKLVGYSPPKS